MIQTPEAAQEASTPVVEAVAPPPTAAAPEATALAATTDRHSDSQHTEPHRNTLQIMTNQAHTLS